MKPTIVKPGVNEDRVLAPAGGAAPVVAYQRAPTLIAGERSGQEVQVWAPDQWRLWPPVAFWAGIWLLFLHHAIFGYQIWPERVIGFICNGFWGLVGIAGAILSLKRPCYITTDTEGIAITGWMSRTIALHWDQILTVKQESILSWFANNLVLKTPIHDRPVTLSLAGYPRRRRDALLAHIRAKTAPQTVSFKAPMAKQSALPPGARSQDMR